MLSYFSIEFSPFLNVQLNSPWLYSIRFTLDLSKSIYMQKYKIGWVMWKEDLSGWYHWLCLESLIVTYNICHLAGINSLWQDMWRTLSPFLLNIYSKWSLSCCFQSRTSLIWRCFWNCTIETILWNQVMYVFRHQGIWHGSCTGWKSMFTYS